MAKILVIDDEASIRLTFKTLLSKEGHEVVAVEDHASAMDAIKKTDFDVVFADILLSETHTGIDILREVKDRGLRFPVIMITGQPDIQTAAESVRLGAFDYVPKPVRKETLLRVTNAAIKHKALEDEKKRIENEKESYRRHLEAIFSSVNEGIVTVDHQMRVVAANNATERICGVVANDIMGDRLSMLPGDCMKACANAVSETLDSGKTVKDRHVFCSRDDRPGQTVALTASPLTDQDGLSNGAVLVIRDITRITDLERELTERNQFHGIIGKSKKMQAMYGLLEALSGTDTTVLVLGESGTGKELVSVALHRLSPRSNKPLVRVNCSALAESLLESELFGHVKGAFTGAVRDKMGRFQAAEGGTIFLDEIGDISPQVQLKLLRVLQEKEFERVGDSTTFKADVRVVAATNQDIKQKVAAGEFREDLYYRLKVVEISLPPLRERRDDIPLLIEHFCQIFNKTFNKSVEGVYDDVLTVFMQYSWPGNIRELRHAIEHAFVLCKGNMIDAPCLPTEIIEFRESEDAEPQTRLGLDRQTVLDALKKTDWNKAKASRVLGISRPTLYRKIQEYKLREI